MADYIKRSDVMTICEIYSQHCFETSDSRGQDIADRILDDIVEMNIADVEEVVRCCECKYQITHTCRITGVKTLFCDYGEKPVAVEPTHFCRYGERREE